jgi:transposase
MVISQQTLSIIGGIDTHKDTHAVAAITVTGQFLGAAQFNTSPTGYRSLLTWLRGFGILVRIGIEGTGSYGAGLTRFLQAEGVDLVEVIRPKREWRRRHGKSDPTDAEAAARAALSGEANGTPKGQDGQIEAIRLLRLARRSAVLARTQASNQLQSIVETAPAELREQLRHLRHSDLVARGKRFRVGAIETPLAAARLALRSLSLRWLALDAEIAALDARLCPLVHRAAPQLCAVWGIGPDTAASLLVAAGDNPERLGSEASFAALCGVSPVDASSGRNHRHRLNRGGNRDANRALWVVAMVRMAKHPRTQEYVRRRTQQGLGKKEIIRCLKRYIAREIYRVLIDGIVPATARSLPTSS